MPEEAKSRPGVLSSVFGFVARELGSFVTTATGGEAQSHASTSHGSGLKHSGSRRRGKGRDGDREEGWEESRSQRQPVVLVQKRVQRQGSWNERRQAHSEDEGVETTGSQETEITGSRTISSPSTSHNKLQRRLSVTMPGSMYARSPSPQPEPTQEPENDRRVHFTNSPRYAHHLTPLRGGADDDHPLRPVKAAEPFRPPAVPSVRQAVNRFSDKDADPSILLPQRSPPKPSPPKTQLSEKARGKQRAVDLADEVGNTSGEVRVRGKEKELWEAREQQRVSDAHGTRDEDERTRDKEMIRVLEAEVAKLKAQLASGASNHPRPPPPPPPPPPPLLPAAKGLQRGHPSADSMFVDARARLRQQSVVVEAPINPPPLRKQPTGIPSVNISSDKMAAFLSEMKHVRLRKVSAGEDNPGRAPPSEVAEAIARARSHSIGAASAGDRARSRSISVSANRGPCRAPSRAGSVAAAVANMEAASLAEPVRHRVSMPALRPTARASEDAKVGEKRLREQSSSESHDAVASKRQATGSTSSSYVPRSRIPIPATSNNHAPNRSWPSTERDTMTPSLISDNEREVDRGDNSGDSELPATPQHEIIDVDMEPGLDLRVHAFQQKADASVPREKGRPGHTPAPVPAPRRSLPISKPDVFSKRTPASPLPKDSPAKPRPPARRRPPLRTADTEDDPLFLSFTAPRDEEVSPTVHVASRRSSTAASHASTSLAHPKGATKSKSSGHGGRGRPKSARRGTLDEELRAAGDDPQPDFDSGELVGVGTRSKRKRFLAHGGAGGAPVFMGEGYVDGVQAGSDKEGGHNDADFDSGEDEYEYQKEEEEEEEEYDPKPKKSKGRGSRR